MPQKVNMRSNGDNAILNMSFSFALKILTLGDSLMASKRWVIANQIIKSGTSIGANIREAQNAESKSDFIHKFKIAAKEVEETLYWLELCAAAKYDNDNVLKDLITDLTDIKRVINRIIVTSKQSLANSTN